MKTVNRFTSSSNGSSNGLSDCQFLGREELEVEAIIGKSMSAISPLWCWIDPDIPSFLGNIMPVGPIKSRQSVTLIVVSDYNERFRRPCDIFRAVKVENIQNGQIWDLMWLLARIRGNDPLWDKYAGSVALGSPVSDGLPGRRFPYINGTAREPHVRLISESSIGDPSRRLKFLGRSVDAPSLQMAKSMMF